MLILRVDDYARGLLPPHEVKYLPSPKQKKQNQEVGKTVFGALKRVLWRSLCDPESDVYKAWFNNGMMVVLDKKYMTAAIVSAMSGIGIGIKALAVSATALAFKMGLEVYCDRYKPAGVMETRQKK
jgi:hypothetical protein